jgi:cytochrome P450
VHDLAHPLPVQVIAQLFGVPREDVGHFTRWSAGIVEFMKSPQSAFEICLRSQASLLELRAYLRSAIAERRAKPRDDVLSLMVHAQSEGDALTEEDILGTSVTLLLGGHETTTRLLTTTILELLRHPAQLEQLRADPSLMETAVEEFLRYCGPFHRDQRVCLTDTTVGGIPVAKGDFILLMLAAANRDPEQFADPDTLDLARKPNRHLAFGFGPHICLGAHLARLEMAVALGTLLATCRELRLLSEPIAWDFGFLRGPRELVIGFGR